MTKSVQGCGQYAEISCDSPHGTKRYPIFSKSFLNPCPEKCRQTGLWTPIIFGTALQFVYDLGSWGTSYGMRLHAAGEKKIILVKSVCRKKNGPILFSKSTYQFIYRFDNPACQWRNRQIPLLYKIVLYHIDYEQCRFFSETSSMNRPFLEIYIFDILHSSPIECG